MKEIFKIILRIIVLFITLFLVPRIYGRTDERSISATATPADLGNANQQQAGLTGNRFLTFNAVIRVNQIEVSRDKNVGDLNISQLKN